MFRDYHYEDDCLRNIFHDKVFCFLFQIFYWAFSIDLDQVEDEIGSFDMFFHLNINAKSLHWEDSYIWNFDSEHQLFLNFDTDFPELVRIKCISGII